MFIVVLARRCLLAYLLFGIMRLSVGLAEVGMMDLDLKRSWRLNILKALNEGACPQGR